MDRVHTERKPTIRVGGKDRGGYALLITLSVLMLLMGFATVFVSLGTVERDITRAYVDEVRARMLAESALDYGLGSVRNADLMQSWTRVAGAPADSWYYRGEDTNLNFKLDGGETDIIPNGRLDTAAVPLEKATSVSFHKGTTPDGLGYSVTVDGTYEVNGDVGAVKVVDCSSQININNFNSGGHPGNLWLPRILNNLGSILTRPGTSTPIEPALGTKLMSQLAARGYRPYSDKLELLSAPSPVFSSQADLDVVAPYITTNSWIDPDTISVPAGATSPQITPRSPVNVNTASYEVLVAVLKDMRCTYRTYNYNATTVATMLNAPATITISQAEAQNMARFIMDSRTTFYSGAGGIFDWMHFKMEVINGLGSLSQPKKDLLYAALNPNTTLRKRGPDLIVAEPDPYVAPDTITLIDKFDITDGGTELCFGGMGYYEVEAHGRVYRKGIIVAEHRIRTVARVSDTFRITTQRQFEQNRVWSHPSGPYGDLHDSGNVPVVSLPEYPFNATGNRYKSIGPDPYTGAANPTTWCATWDGALMLNGLAMYTVGDDTRPVSTTRRSFMASFGRGTLKADMYPARGNSPGYAYSMRECDNSSTYYYPLYSITGDSAYTSAWGSFQRPAVLGTAAMPAMLEGGHDLTAFGIYLNFLKQKRFHTYYGDDMPAPEATIEFFVKPEIDIREWGRNASNVCKQLCMFDWGPAKPPLTNYQIRIFTARGRVFADFFYGSGTGGTHYVLYGEADWPPHSWHHIEVNFSDKATVGGKVVTQPNAQLFIDGNPASMLGGSATALTGATAPRGPAMKLPAAVTVTNRGNFSYGVDPWLGVGTGITVSTDGYFSMARCNWLGNIDNLGMHWWRQHDAAFIPKSRYHDPSYRAYSRNITYSDIGKAFDVGVYLRRMAEIESKMAAAGGQITLGTLSCTHTHPFHEHFSGGHGGDTGAFGHLSPRVMIEAGGATNYFSNYDGCAGVAIAVPGGGGGLKNYTLRSGNKLYVAVEFEIASKLPVVTSAYLDDLTMTYSTGIKILNRTTPDK